MSRNHYDDAFGVAEIQWREGEPGTSGLPILVEVWRSHLDNIDPQYGTPTRPRVRITARIEVRIHYDGQWYAIGYNGQHAAPTTGQVRRWAPLPSRSWEKTITLDGWGHP